MQSNDKTYYGVQIYRTSDENGVVTTSSLTTVAADYRRFWCSNGLIQGNKKSPNPVAFNKVRSFDLHRSLFEKRSGYPNHTWTQIESDNNDRSIPWQHDSFGAIRQSHFSGRAPGLQDQALRQIYNALRYGSANLAVDLAEARTTLKMLRNASSVRGIAKDFMRGLAVPKNYSSSRRLKYTSDKWLEYRYGWLPFLSSTYELLKTLSAQIDRRTIVPVEGRASYNAAWKEVETPSGAIRTELSVQQSMRCYIKCRVRARPTLEIYDFTSLNPLGIAWELVPLSFVADWFVNVGDCLSLWEDHILFANRFVDGFQTWTVREDASFTGSERFSGSIPYWPDTGKPMSGYLFWKQDDWRARREYRTKDRSLLGSLPSPGGIRVEVKLGAKRLLDAAALIRSAFGNPRLK